MATEQTHQPALDVEAIRKHFPAIGQGRIVTNNAASTQPPVELADLYRSLSPDYENVHRGQSTASRHMTELFESSYDTIADFLGAPGRQCIALYRNATEAHNSVMYSLMADFRDGDNVVTTAMEHNSNYVPWYALSREIMPKFGRSIEYRIARFDPVTGELDLEHLASLVDDRTKLICASGASNFFGTKNPIAKVREIANMSGYKQPNGEVKSWLLVDGAQLVPSTYVDVVELDVDFLSFSFHKLLAPFGMGVLYGKEHLLEQMSPFLYGGDMVGTAAVSPTHVGYNVLPWKFSAGTPNILGAIVSGQAIRIRNDVREAMERVTRHNRALTEVAMKRMSEIEGLVMYGPRDAKRRTSLVAFNVEGREAQDLAEALNDFGVESRAGCHCAGLAHHAGDGRSARASRSTACRR